MATRIVAIALAAAAMGTVRHPRGEIARTEINDNRIPAGVLRGSVLTLHLDARIGMWYPNGDREVGAAVPAFAEAGRPPQIPGPLVRVRAGTTVEVFVRNRLNDTLVVRGLHDRVGRAPPRVAGEGIRLAPGEARSVRFRLDVPGTYYYWGTTMGREVNWRTGIDAQLTGGIVVDPANTRSQRDRIFVIGLWTDTAARAYTQRKRILAVINGRSWPHTERLVYGLGDTVHWRVINATGDNHPMHLHGFYFAVDARGDGVSNTTYEEGLKDHVVTESVSPGNTIDMTWVAERVGNWLFHCHLPEHIAPRGPLGLEPAPSPVMPVQAGASHQPMRGAMTDMGGLVMGIEVRSARSVPAQAIRAATQQPRSLRLLIHRNGGGSDSTPYFAFTLQDSARATPQDTGLQIGPPLVLVRGEPVRIMLVNALSEQTSVHWHGIELESFYDGVGGFSGNATRTAPTIAPHDSFEVRFAPPRAGTFIYHTHVDEERQEPAGLSGPIVVLEPGQRWNPTLDHTVLITSPWSFEEGRTAVLVNGSRAPQPVTLRAGVPHRFRFINMTTRRPALRVEMRRDTTLITWRELAKDAADFPEARRAPRTAVHQVSVGETFDVEVTPEHAGEMRIDVRLGGNVSEHPLFATLPLRVIP